MREDWVETEIGRAGKVVSGGTPKTSNTEYWGDEIPWVTPADLSGYTQKFISKGRKSISAKGLKNSSAKLLPANSVLFSSRAPIGYVAIAKNGICTNQGFKSLVPFNCLNSEFVYYYFKSIKQKAENHASGTTFKELSAKAFSLLPIPLAPLPEQRAIVAKIEKLFSDLDNGIANLKAAKAKLDIYRQAVLKKAFEGELTKEWREASGRRIEDWQDKPLVDVSQKITDGEHFRPKTQDSGIYFLSAKDVRENGIDFSSPLYISEEDAQKALKRCNPEKGDILIVSRGATVGRMCVVNTDKVFCVLGSVILIKANSSINSLYLAYALKSPIAYQNLIALSGSTAQQAIYLRDIKNVVVPIPSLEEQHAIVAAIEARLSVCDKLAESIDQSLEKSEALRQSILKKAFAGNLLSQAELVACRQEPDWEPAAKLLERIKKEESSRSAKKQAKNR